MKSEVDKLVQLERDIAYWESKISRYQERVKKLREELTRR